LTLEPQHCTCVARGWKPGKEEENKQASELQSSEGSIGEEVLTASGIQVL
jgi:hypothetical protein